MSKYGDWQKRKTGFDQFVEIVKSEAPPNSDLKKLTTLLYDFTTELFDFFLNGFGDFLGIRKEDRNSTDPIAVKLIPSAEYPPEYVLQKIIQQASFDLTVIQRAIEQRKNEKLCSLLSVYDQLALSALAIAFPEKDEETWLIDPVEPFVYFQRDTSVRIIPYANALLIGVPYSAIDQPIDLLSIPHEVGHHIYETGRFADKEPINLFFEKYFADQPDWIQNWLEEIFADLYGFLVAGPIVGFSLQEILFDNLPEELCKDDGDHPAGIVRPFIYSSLFEKLQFPRKRNYSIQKLTKDGMAETLVNKWSREGKNRGFAKKFKPSTSNNAIDRDDACEILSFAMYKMYVEINNETNNSFVFPTDDNVSDSKLSPWTSFSSINLADPFYAFDIGPVIDNQIERIRNMGQLHGKLGLSKAKKNKYWLTDQIKYWKDEKEKEVPPLAPNIWKLIFTALNWAEHPDDTRPVHGPENIR